MCSLSKWLILRYYTFTSTTEVWFTWVYLMKKLNSYTARIFDQYKLFLFFPNLVKANQCLLTATDKQSWKRSDVYVYKRCPRCKRWISFFKIFLDLQINARKFSYNVKDIMDIKFHNWSFATPLDPIRKMTIIFYALIETCAVTEFQSTLIWFLFWCSLSIALVSLVCWHKTSLSDTCDCKLFCTRSFKVDSIYASSKMECLPMLREKHCSFHESAL